MDGFLILRLGDSILIRNLHNKHKWIFFLSLLLFIVFIAGSMGYFQIQKEVIQKSISPWLFKGAYVEYKGSDGTTVRYEIVDIVDNCFYCKYIFQRGSFVKSRLLGPFNIDYGHLPFISPSNISKTLDLTFSIPYKYGVEYGPMRMKLVRLEITFKEERIMKTAIGFRVCKVYLVNQTLRVEDAYSNIPPRVGSRLHEIYIDKEYYIMIAWYTVPNIKYELISTNIIK